MILRPSYPREFNIGLLLIIFTIIIAGLSACSDKKQKATTIETGPTRQFKCTPSLDSLGAGEFILVSFNHNIMDTLDRFLVSSFDHIEIKGRHFSIVVNRIDIDNYTVHLTDHRSYDTNDPNYISAHYEQIEFSAQDTLDIAIARKIANPPSHLGIEVNVNKTSTYGNTYEISGRASLPVLDGNDMDSSYRNLSGQ